MADYPGISDIFPGIDEARYCFDGEGITIKTFCSLLYCPDKSINGDEWALVCHKDMVNAPPEINSRTPLSEEFRMKEHVICTRPMTSRMHEVFFHSRFVI